MEMALPADELGFDFPTGPIPLPRQPLSAEEEEKALADAIRQKSLVRVDVLSELLTQKAIDPGASTKTVVDALEASYKLSGLAAKNAPKSEDARGMVSIVINMPSNSPHPQPPRVVEGAILSSEENEAAIPVQIPAENPAPSGE